jgi:RNA polymerase sigma-70 factor (ECF subfamily)
MSTARIGLRWRRRADAGPLLRQAVGDADAFHAFYVAYVERVTAYFARRVLDADVAFDLTGETFALALERRAQFRGTSPEEEQGWLFSIARSQLAHYWRDGSVERAALRRLGLDPPIATSADLERVQELAGLPQLREDLATAVQRLSSDQAYAVTQRVLAERSYAELAHELNVTEQVVRARVSRGLRQLADELGAYAEDVA